MIWPFKHREQPRYANYDATVAFLAARATFAEYLLIDLMRALAKSEHISAIQVKDALVHRIITMAEEKDGCVPPGQEQRYRDHLSFMVQVLVQEVLEKRAPQSK